MTSPDSFWPRPEVILWSHSSSWDWGCWEAKTCQGIQEPQSILSPGQQRGQWDEHPSAAPHSSLPGWPSNGMQTFKLLISVHRYLKTHLCIMLSGKKHHSQRAQQENIHYTKVKWAKIKGLCTRKKNKINTEKLAIKEICKTQASGQISNTEDTLRKHARVWRGCLRNKWEAEVTDFWTWWALKY